MRTIRRLYFYLVTLISLEVVIWGLVNLLRTTVDLLPGTGSTNLLSKGLSLVLVGLPIVLLHWYFTQGEALKDEDERATRIRALFFYALRAAILVPVVQSLLAIFSRTLLQLLGLNTISAIVGSGQTTIDNLIAIAINLAAFAYVERRLQDDWQVNPPDHHLAEVRRLYRTLWVFYTLVLTVFGLVNLLRYTFLMVQGGQNVLATSMVNGLALVLVGAPLWAVTWLTLQRSLGESAENLSLLRTVLLYLLTLIPAVAGLTAAGVLVSGLVRWALGQYFTLPSFLDEYASSLAWLIPMVTLWIYHGRHLQRHWLEFTDELRQAALSRLYNYILSLLGNAATFAGLYFLLSALTDLAFGKMTLGAITLRNTLGNAIGLLTAGLPIWIIFWRRAQLAAAPLNDLGDHERRSLVRKIYLYILLFASVVGGMFATGILFNRLLNAALGNPMVNFNVESTRQALLVLLIVLWLVYHLRTLRQDGRIAQQALGKRHAAFPTLILQAGEEDAAFTVELVNALQRQAPGLPVAVQPIAQGVPDETLSAARLIVLSAELAAHPPEALRLWLNEFHGQRLIVPLPSEGITWLGSSNRSPRELASEAAGAVRHLAEGQAVKQAAPTNPWVITGYVLAGFFALEILFVIINLVISLSNNQF
jgi:hypothetical protein